MELASRLLDHIACNPCNELHKVQEYGKESEDSVIHALGYLLSQGLIEPVRGDYRVTVAGHNLVMAGGLLEARNWEAEKRLDTFSQSVAAKRAAEAAARHARWSLIAMCISMLMALIVLMA